MKFYLELRFKSYMNHVFDLSDDKLRTTLKRVLTLINEGVNKTARFTIFLHNFCFRSKRNWCSFLRV